MKSDRARCAQGGNRGTEHRCPAVDAPAGSSGPKLPREQKPIVIGAKGERLKRVGTQARKELNELFGRRLHLTLYVKVRENWADDSKALSQLGLE